MHLPLSCEPPPFVGSSHADLAAATHAFVQMEPAPKRQTLAFSAGCCPISGHLLCLNEGTGRCQPCQGGFAHPRASSMNALMEWMQVDSLRDRSDGWCLCPFCAQSFRDWKREKSRPSRPTIEDAPLAVTCPCCKIERDIFGSTIAERTSESLRSNGLQHALQIQAPTEGCTIGHDTRWARDVSGVNIGVSHWFSRTLQHFCLDYGHVDLLSNLKVHTIKGCPTLCRAHTSKYLSAPIGQALQRLQDGLAHLHTELGRSHHHAPSSPSWRFDGASPATTECNATSDSTSTADDMCEFIPRIPH